MTLPCVKKEGKRYSESVNQDRASSYFFSPSKRARLRSCRSFKILFIFYPSWSLCANALSSKDRKREQGSDSPKRKEKKKGEKRHHTWISRHAVEHIHSSFFFFFLHSSSLLLGERMREREREQERTIGSVIHTHTGTDAAVNGRTHKIVIIIIIRIKRE